MILKTALGLKEYLGQFSDEELRTVEIFTSHSDGIEDGRLIVCEEYGSEPSNKDVLIGIEIITNG